MYKIIKYGKFHERRNFAQAKLRLELPYLIENQLDSFKKFAEQDIVELFNDFSPIMNKKDGNLELYLLNPRFDEPDTTIRECKEKEISYTRALRCDAQFVNTEESGDIKEAKGIFLLDFPWMTPNGTFVINGAERIIVNQIIRSSGVLFKQASDPKTGALVVEGMVIPTRGAWIEYGANTKDVLYVSVDKSNKTPLPIFLKSIGIETYDDMKRLFGENQKLVEVLDKIPERTYEESMSELYGKIKSGDSIPLEGIQSYLQAHLMTKEHYDLMAVGRYKYNKKLDFIERAKGHKLAKAYKISEKVDENGEVIQEAMTLEKGVLVTKEIAALLDKNRADFREPLKLEHDLDSVPTYIEVIEVVANQPDDTKRKVKIIGNNSVEDRELISTSDIIAATSYWLNLFDNVGSFDDVDNLANRRLRLTGELLQNEFRQGLIRLRKNTVDKMSTNDVKEMNPKNLLNAAPLQQVIKAFFGSSQLSQFMSQINPLDEITHKRRMSALGPGGITRDRAGIEVRDVHPTHYGRICPVETPEGQNIGLISSLATYAKVDKYGFIMTPYFKVVDGKVTEEAVYMTADEEAKHYIAEANTELNDDLSFKDKTHIYARHELETDIYTAKDIDFMDISPKQIMSISASCIPFLEHDDANRTLMGSNMQRQSIPLIKPEAPFVATGIEYKAAHDSGAACICEADGIVTYVDGQTIKVREDESGFEHVYNLTKFMRSNQSTCINQTPICEIGEIVKKGDVLADGPSMDKGELALGRNVVVAFMTWQGYNYEDAVVMNENLVKNDVYTSIHIEKYEVQARDTKLGKEVITRDLPQATEAILKNLDSRGIVIPGTVVKENDILVGKLTPKGQTEPSPQDRLMQAIFGSKSDDHKNTSLRVPHGGGGIVQTVRHYTRQENKSLMPSVEEVVRVYIVQRRKIQVGDKMSGRHGNKGVISNILPQEDMPYLEDGTPVDILLNPQGVPSRMNLGQVLEMHLGMACKKLGVLAATEVFDYCRDEDLREMMNEAHMTKDGKVTLYDGRTGEAFDNPITVGVMYMIKLDHMVDDKLHARNTGRYVLVTQQPIGGKAQNGGQRFGEMEVWALEAYGAAYTLREMLTVKSDDMLGRNKVFKAISTGREIPEPGLPESFRVFARELKALGIHIELLHSETGENVVNQTIVDQDSDEFVHRINGQE